RARRICPDDLPACSSQCNAPASQSTSLLQAGLYIYPFHQRPRHCDHDNSRIACDKWRLRWLGDPRLQAWTSSTPDRTGRRTIGYSRQISLLDLMQSSTWSYLGPGEDVNGIISLGIRWIQGASWAKVARFANLAAQQLT